VPSFHRRRAAAVVAAAALIPAVAVAAAAPAVAAPNPVWQSIYGADLRDFMSNVNLNSWPYGMQSPTAYIVSGVNFPDGIALAPLAGATNSITYLANEHGSIGEGFSMWSHAGRRGTTRVVIIGGTAAVHKRTESLVRDGNFKGAVERIAGTDRYDTAALVATRAYPQAETVFLASGSNYADALSAGPAAAHVKAPVLLTAQGGLPARTSQALASMGAKNVVVIGGEAAVGASVVQQLEARGLSVRRVAGDNRYSTAVEVARAFFTAPEAGYIAAGNSFAAALGATAAAVKADVPLLLREPHCGTEVLNAYIDEEPNLVLARGFNLNSHPLNPIANTC
jgi:putative cell wall-binding protein